MGQTAASHDMQARIDLATYTPLSWKPGLARFAADLYVDRQPHPYCPHVNLKRILGELRSLGYVFNVGIEPEHFLVSRGADGRIVPWDPGHVDTLAKPCYDFKGLAQACDYLRDDERRSAPARLGVLPVRSRGRQRPVRDQFQVCRCVDFRRPLHLLQDAGRRGRASNGAIVTFMAKPFADRTGSGHHMHYHLADAETGRNVFSSDTDPRKLGLSEVAYHFLGGVLAHARACVPSRRRRSTATNGSSSARAFTAHLPATPGRRPSSVTATTIARR